MHIYKHENFLRKLAALFVIAASVFLTEGCKQNTSHNKASVTTSVNAGSDTSKISSAAAGAKAACCKGAPSRSSVLAAAKKNKH